MAFLTLFGQTLCSPCAQAEGVVTPSTEIPTQLVPIDGAATRVPAARTDMGTAMQCDECQGALD